MEQPSYGYQQPVGNYDYQLPPKHQSKPQTTSKKPSAGLEALYAAMQEDVYVGRVVVYEDQKLISIKDHG